MNSNLSSITQKKQYLKSYRSTRCLIQILESEIFNFQSLSFESSYILHPVEGTDTYANYSLYRAQVDTLIFKLQSQRLEAVRYYQNIIQCIETVTDPVEQNVLRLKYIHGDTLEVIAEKLNYSLRQIHNIHRHAVEHSAFLKERSLYTTVKAPLFLSRTYSFPFFFLFRSVQNQEESRLNYIDRLNNTFLSQTIGTEKSGILEIAG